MKNDYSNIELRINLEMRRFEMHVENYIAFIEYIFTRDNILFLTHTEVPKALEGKGVGAAIVEKALRYIRENDYTLAPLCPFVTKYVTSHPEWQALLAQGYHV